MPEENPQPAKPHSRAIVLGSVAAIVLMGISAFALAPGVQTTNSTEPAREMAAAQPMPRTTPPRMLENGAPFSFADLVERVSPAVVTITSETVETQASLNADDLPAPFRDFFNQYGRGPSRTH